MVDGDLEEFYRYSTQKWLWNEPAQLLRRYLQFNMDALIHVAEEATGDGKICVDVTKLPEGNSNKVFLVTMQDGKQLVVNLPNPNSGPVHYTTASEVATMQFVRGPSTLVGCLLSCERKKLAYWLSRSEKSFIFQFRKFLDITRGLAKASSGWNTL